MIIIGTDHAGFQLKELLVKWLIEKKYEVKDISKEYMEQDDYPDVVQKLCSKMLVGDLGIMICGTGIGSSIAANKLKGMRAAICYDKYTAEMTRKHNDANLLCLGARTDIAKDREKLKDIVEVFLNTKFSGEIRHIKRLEKIASLER